MIARSCAVFAALMFAVSAAGQCRCPDGAWSRNVLMTLETGRDAGLVACGHEEERQPDRVIASELQIFECAATKPLLEFGALQTAVLRARGPVLQVTELERWPFGKAWEWMQVPVYEWHLSPGESPEQSRRTLQARPAVSAAEIRAFIQEYTQWLSGDANDRSDQSEELVARLFTAAVAGDPQAEALFLTMSDDAGLDGAAAESYSQAIETYAALRETRPRSSKH